MKAVNVCITWLIFWVVSSALCVAFEVPNYNFNLYFPSLWALNLFVIFLGWTVGLLPLTVYILWRNKDGNKA